MKKLLSILASVAVAGSSASAVVACSVNPTVQNNNDSDEITGNGPSGKNNDSPSTIPSGKDADQPINNGGSTNRPITAQQLYQADKKDLLSNMSAYAKDQIPMDLWGFNGKSTYPVLDYLNHMKDKNGKQVLGNDTYSTINTILGLVDGVNVPNPSALGSTVSGLLPILQYVLPMFKGKINGLIDKAGGTQKIEKSVQKIFTPQIKEIVDEVIKNGSDLSKYKDITFNQSLDSIAMGLAYIAGVLTGDFKNVQMFAEMTTPEAVVSKDNGETLANAAVDYLANTAVNLITKKTSISIANLAKHAKETGSDVPHSIINNGSPEKTQSLIISEQDVDVISDTIQLLMAYVGQFDAYRIPKGTTNNAIVFADKSGTTLPIYSTINDVRKTKLKDAKVSTEFNPLRFISDLSYYLSDLDQPDGLNRVQALLAIFFADDDRSAANKIILNWDNDGQGEGVHGWSHATGAEAHEATKSMPSKLVQTILGNVMSKIEPDTFKTGALAGIINFLGFSWDNITKWTTHNVYMLIQSLVWNKGLELSDTGTSFKIPPFSQPAANGGSGYGMASLNSAHTIIGYTYPGLGSLKSWNTLLQDGFMKVLFGQSKTNIYSFLDDLSTNSDWTAFLNMIKGDGTDKDTGKRTLGIVSMIRETALPMLVPFSDAKDKTSTSITLNNSLSSYSGKDITFTKDGKTTVINPTIGSYDEVHTSAWGWDNAYSDSYKHPTMNKVVADKMNDNGTTDIYVSAEQLYNKSLTDHDYKSLSNGKSYPVVKKIDGMEWTNGADILARSLKITENGTPVKIVGTPQVLSKSSGGSTCSAKIKVTIDGPAKSDMQVTGHTFFYEGHSWFTYYGDDVWFGNKVMDTPWAGKDELNLHKKLNFDASNPSFDISKLDYNTNGLDMYKHPMKITVNDKDGKPQSIVKNIDTPKGMTLDVQSIASHSISWLLNTLGIDSNALNLPFMDNDSMGSLILKIGSFIDTKKLGTYGIDLSKFQDLANVIFGVKDQKDIVTRLLDMINEPADKLGPDLSAALGIDGQNKYEKTGLIGALLEAFTPGLIGENDPDSNTITGDAQASSPLWDTLLGYKDPNTGKAMPGIVAQAWDWLNKIDKQDLKKFEDVNADKYYIEHWEDNAKNYENFTEADGEIAYTYRWEVAIKQDDGSIVYKWKTVLAVYKMSASRKSTKDNWTINDIQKVSVNYSLED